MRLTIRVLGHELLHIEGTIHEPIVEEVAVDGPPFGFSGGSMCHAELAGYPEEDA